MTMHTVVDTVLAAGTSPGWAGGASGEEVTEDSRTQGNPPCEGFRCWEAAAINLLQCF